MLPLAGVTNATDLGATTLGDRGTVCFLTPFIAFAMPGLGLHDGHSFKIV